MKENNAYLIYIKKSYINVFMNDYNFGKYVINSLDNIRTKSTLIAKPLYFMKITK